MLGKHTATLPQVSTSDQSPPEAMGDHGALVSGERGMQRRVGNLYLRRAFLQDDFPVFPMAEPLTVTPEQRIFQGASIDPTRFRLLREKTLC